MSKLLAPNGKQSKLTPEQYKLVRTPAFKKWFGDWENDPANASKVIDKETKEPLVVYHGTNADFTIFDTDEDSENRQGGVWNADYPDGYIFMISDKNQAKYYGKRIIPLFVNARHPTIKKVKKGESLVLPFDDEGLAYEGDAIVTDGINSVVGTQDDNAIKLADGSNTTFDVVNPDIRYEGGGGVDNWKKIIEINHAGDYSEELKSYVFKNAKIYYSKIDREWLLEINHKIVKGYRTLTIAKRQAEMMLLDTYKNGGDTKNKIMAKQMKNQLSDNYAEGGVTYSEWLKDDYWQEQFDAWMQDGNVSKKADGTYSTQDAQYRNSLKGMSELKKYFYNEFIKGQNSGYFADGGGIENYENFINIDKMKPEKYKIVTNFNTLKSLAKNGFIELHEKTGLRYKNYEDKMRGNRVTNVRHDYIKLAKSTSFEYNNKKYTIGYIKGFNFLELYVLEDLSNNSNNYADGGSADDKHLIAKAIEYITGYSVDTNTIQKEANNYSFKYKSRNVFSTLNAKLIDDTIRMHRKSLENRYEKGGEAGKFGKGGNVPSIEKRVAEVNALIQEGNEKGLEVIDKTITWEAPMKYNPIKYTNGVIYISYKELDLYKNNKGMGREWKNESYRIGKHEMGENVFKGSAQTDALSHIARMYRSAINQFNKYGYADGGVVEYETKRIVNEAKNQKKNTHFAIHKPTNSIVFTWDFSGYDTKEMNENKEHYFYYDVKDIVSGNVDKYVKSDYAIVQRKDLEKRGIDLNNYLVFMGQKYDSSESNSDTDSGKTGFNDEGTSMVLYHEKNGNFLVPKGQVYLYLYDVEDSRGKLQSSEYDWVFYPYASQNMAWASDFIPPLKKIWTKKFQKDHKGSEHLLGVIKAYLIDKENGEKELFIDMMSVNPTKMKKGIMSYMIKELRDTFKLEQDQVTFSQLTDEGKKFVEKKTYADGGGLEGNSNRNETQKNNFEVSYKLGDKFTLGQNFGNKKEEVYITEIMPSGLFFKVDKSSKVFSIKTLHSKGSTYTSGEYLVPIKKEYADGGDVNKPYIYYFNDGENDITFTTFEEAYNEVKRLGYSKFRDNLGGEYFVERDLNDNRIYEHKYNPNITLEFIENTNKGIKGLQKNPKSLSKKERKEGIIVYYSDSELKELFTKKYADGGDVEEIKTKYQIAGSDKNGVYTYSKRVADEIAKMYGGNVEEDGSKWYVRFEEKFANGGDIPHEDKMFQLPLEMVVYVPSTQDVDKVISVDEMVNRVNEVKEYLGSKFGGYSSTDKLGGFVDSKGNLINEDVTQVTSFATQEAFEENKEELIKQLAKWGKEWGQEAIGFEFEGDLLYVPQELKSDTKVDEYRRGGFMYEVQKKGSPSNDMRETMFTAKNLTDLKKKIIEKHGTSEGFIVSRRTQQGYYVPVKFENGGEIKRDYLEIRTYLKNKDLILWGLTNENIHNWYSKYTDMDKIKNAIIDNKEYRKSLILYKDYLQDLILQEKEEGMPLKKRLLRMKGFNIQIKNIEKILNETK